MREQTVATDATKKPEDAVGARVLGISGYVSSLPRGDRAQLQRMRSGTDHVPPEVFWRIVDRYEIKPHDELFWLHVIPLMVQHEHKNGVRAGAALFRVGVSAARIERWLRLDRPAALAEARRLLTRVNSGFDWPRFGKLLLFWNDPARMAFARDFFLAHSPTKHDDQSTKGGE